MDAEEVVRKRTKKQIARYLNQTRIGQNLYSLIELNHHSLKAQLNRLEARMDRQDADKAVGDEDMVEMRDNLRILMKNQQQENTQQALRKLLKVPWTTIGDHVEILSDQHLLEKLETYIGDNTTNIRGLFHKNFIDQLFNREFLARCFLYDGK